MSERGVLEGERKRREGRKEPRGERGKGEENRSTEERREEEEGRERLGDGGRERKGEV